MTVKGALSWAKKELRDNNVREPDSSAMVLLCDALGVSRTKLLSDLTKKLSKLQEKKYQKYIERRKKHESVWHILGYVYFWGLEYEVNHDVMVPRPETEMLIENVVNYLLGRGKEQEKVRILDVGTGSGTIAIALAAEFPGAEVTGTDVSVKALKVAKKNAKRNGIRNVKFVESNLFSNIKDKFDIITANLPYIPDEQSVAMEVHHYEPALALYGGRDGLDIYRDFFAQVLGHITPNGAIFCEIGISQGEEFKKIVGKRLPGASVTVLSDLAGIDRIGIIKMAK
ncbi:MAG: peptide chain release factor N(5)-glutamine methyltransferase [Patescibacteria group bacterium]|nr:peptide chain release factor N(5)-glutamine methyltransferase [Patescibacteria group bacterium]